MSLNRRRSPRVVKGLAVDITNIDGEHFSATTLNISSNGFGIQCSTEERNQLTPHGDFVDMGKPVEFEVDLKLPGDAGKIDNIHAKCRVLYSRRLTNNICEIGMRYMDINDGGGEKLEEFIENASSIDH